MELGSDQPPSRSLGEEEQGDTSSRDEAAALTDSTLCPRQAAAHRVRKAPRESFKMKGTPRYGGIISTSFVTAHSSQHGFIAGTQSSAEAWGLLR